MHYIYNNRKGNNMTNKKEIFNRKIFASIFTNTKKIDSTYQASTWYSLVGGLTIGHVVDRLHRAQTYYDIDIRTVILKNQYYN